MAGAGLVLSSAGAVAGSVPVHGAPLVGAEQVVVVSASGLVAPATPQSVAEPDEPAPVGPLPDPYRAQQWHLDRLGLDGGRTVPDGVNQVVAVLDSGVDLLHPDLVDAFLRDDGGAVVGRDFVDDDDVPEDPLGHGTMVAGVIAARTGNGLGVAGVVGTGARLLPIRVLDDQGRGTAARVAAGIDWAVEQGATVINLSVESAGVAALRDDPELRAAVDAALAADVAIVVAAGNGDERAEASGTDGLLVVGATDRDDQRAGFSDRGRTDIVMAPGIEIVSTWCGADDTDGEGGDRTCDGETHTYGVADGTSFAAPQVSGMVAMLASTGMSPVAAARRVAATTRDVADPGPDATTGRGIVDVGAALGPWPDRPIPASTPADLPLPEAPTAAPGPEVAPAVAPAAAPRRSLATRLTVVVAILVAVGVVARGLVAGAATRARASRDGLR